MSARLAAIESARTNANYLRESLDLFPDLASAFLQDDPQSLVDDLLKSLPEKVADLTDEMRILRVLKRRVHLVVALADIAKIWDWVQVTEMLTQLADLAISRILTAAACELDIEGTPDNPAPGFFVLAVGKYGARELNYSSDIDFNVFYDPEKIVVPNPARAERTLIKLVQKLVRGLEAMTEDGYIFRTDLRLRPDPRSNAVAVSTRTAERYYESLGQNWERAAMIKARVCAGDFSAGLEFCDHVLTPFIWRRNLDYAGIEDILAIKRQIHAKIGQSSIQIAGHHLKLGVGGIREIEFYVQVQQLILGGRHKDIRSPRTVDALDALTQAGFSKTENTQPLRRHYSLLRDLEHVAQMMDDAQTHLVPIDIEKREKFSALAGFESLAEMEVTLQASLTSVHAIYTDLFPDAAPLSSSAGNLVFTGVEPDPATLKALEKLGYKRPQAVWSDMAAWLGGRIKATRAERSRELLTALAPRIIEYSANASDPDEAFNAFGAFLGKLKSGVSVLSMFSKRTDHLADVIGLLVKSPFIADAVAAKPAILDTLSDPDFLQITETQIQDGADLVRGADGFEAAMNAARCWVREERFRISAALLSARITPKDASLLFSALAESSIASLLPFAIGDVERRHGKIKGKIGVLGMGKLGSRDLNAISDLDIMVLYEPGEDETNAQQTYARITQRLISALSAITEEGGLFEVDMALRPSGRAGPVAVTIESFERYYREKAWTWEFMALSRSRVICSQPKAFSNVITAARVTALTCDRQDLNISDDIASMLNRLRKEKPPRHKWDLKNVIGGIRDIEFLAQKSILEDEELQGEDTLSIAEVFEKSSKIFSPDEISKLSNIYGHYLAFTQYTSVQFGKDIPETIDGVAQSLGVDNTDLLESKLTAHQTFIASIVDRFIY